MRSHVTFLSAAVAVVFLAGCSSQQLQTGNSALPGSASMAIHSKYDLPPSGIRPAIPGPTPVPAPVQPSSWQWSLFVDNYDFAAPSVELFKNGTWVANGSFNNGATFPGSNWSDQKYLYVANWSLGNGANVEEYRPNHTTPVFTYTNGLPDVANVSTQVLSGVHYVFVAGRGSGFVNEYKRDTNTIVAACYPGGNVFGVAVAPNGNVFVDYDDSNNVGHIVEYLGGLGGCNGTLLPVTFGTVDGMVLDNAGRLVICDERNAVVDIIDPPYTSISGTLGSGYVVPVFVSINANNSLAFVTDQGQQEVRVLHYPSGALIQTIFVSAPGGAVEWTNYGF